jgi:hypothetical protein
VAVSFCLLQDVKSEIMKRGNINIISLNLIVRFSSGSIMAKLSQIINTKRFALCAEENYGKKADELV